jgi:hypothetical protein
MDGWLDGWCSEVQVAGCRIDAQKAGGANNANTNASHPVGEFLVLGTAGVGHWGRCH